VFSDEAGGTMAEIGLLPFARVALQVATRVLPPYRTRFSKHQFAQPQLLAVLCLMRYEDWTFREAEVRLREHRELREALQLPSVPDYTTLYRFLKRLDDDTIDRGLTETVRQLRRGRRSARVTAGVDGTGLSQNAVSTFFIRRMEQHSGGMTRHRYWLKWLIVADLKQQILLAQRARQGPWCDTRALPGLVDAAGRRAPIGLVLADAEFDSEANHQHHSAKMGSAQHYPGEPSPGRPPRSHPLPDAPSFSTETLWATREDRNYFLGGQTQTFFARSGAHPGIANSPSLAARSHLQPLSLEAPDES
jgi:hypothetical protein